MKLATYLLAATAIVTLAGCNNNAGNNSATMNKAATNTAAPAPAPAGNSAMPAGNAMGGGNGAKPADQPADDMGVEEEGGADANMQ